MSAIPSQSDSQADRPATTTTTTTLNSSPETAMNPTTHQLLDESQARVDATPSFADRLFRPDPLASVSTTTTPGNEFPGSFPRPGDVNRATIPHDGDDFRTAALKLADSVSSTASSSLSSAYQSASHYFPQSVVDTMSAYVPASYSQNKDLAAASGNDPHHVSSPSSDLAAGEREFSLGGSLPVRVNAPAVVALPEHPSKFQAPYKSDVPAATSLATQQTSSAQPGVDGSLPGILSDPAPTTLPSQNQNQNSSSPNVTFASAPVGLMGMGTWENPAPAAEAGLPHAYGAQPTANTGLNEAQSLEGTDTHRAAGAQAHDSTYTNAGGAQLQGAGAGAGVPVRSAQGAAVVGAAAGESEMRKREAPQEQSYPELHAATQDSRHGDLAAQPSQGSQKPVADSAAGAAAVGAAVGENQMRKHEEKHEAKVEAKQERKEEKAEQKVEKKEQKQDAKDGAHARVQPPPTTGAGNDTTYHPAAQHPGSAGKSTDAAGSPAAAQDGEHAHTDAALAHSASRTSHGSHGSEDGAPRKKAGFMQKMKGEALTLLGRVEKNAEKVEEGQRLKNGEPAVEETAPVQH